MSVCNLTTLHLQPHDYVYSVSTTSPLHVYNHASTSHLVPAGDSVPGAGGGPSGGRGKGGAKRGRRNACGGGATGEEDRKAEEEGEDGEDQGIQTVWAFLAQP